MLLESTSKGVVLNVRVIPRAGRSGLAGTRDNALLVRLNAPPVEGAPAVERPVGGGMSSDERERFMRRYGLRPGGAPAAPAPDATQPQPGDATAAVPKKKGNTNEIDSMDVTFKAVTLVSVSASANSELAFAVRNELRGDPMFDPEETDFCPGCTLTADEPPGVFTFRMTVKLKKPLKL